MNLSAHFKNDLRFECDFIEVFYTLLPELFQHFIVVHNLRSNKLIPAVIRL